MSSTGSRRNPDSTARAEGQEVSEVRGSKPGGDEVRDVSEQYQTREDLEKALNESKKSEVQLRKIIDTIPPLAWSSLPGCSYEFVNQRWRDYTGFSLEEARGWGWKDAIHPEDLQKLADSLGKLWASGEPREVEGRFRRHDGVFRWFLFRVEPLRDELGNVVRLYGRPHGP